MLLLAKMLSDIGVEIHGEQSLFDEYELRKAGNFPLPLEMLKQTVAQRGLTVTCIEQQVSSGPTTRFYLSLAKESCANAEFQAHVGDWTATPDYVCEATTTSVQQLAKRMAAIYPRAYIQRSSSIDFPEEVGLEEGIDLGHIFAEAYHDAKGVIE